MYVAKRTWLQQGPRPRGGKSCAVLPVPKLATNAAAKRRGMGDTISLADYFNSWGAGADQGIVIPIEGNTVVLPGGASYTPLSGDTTPSYYPAASTSVTPLPGAAGAMCFRGLFPFLGNKQPDGTCKPVIAISDGNAQLVTIGLVGLLAYKLVRKAL